MPGQGGEFVPGQGGDYVAAQQQQQQVQEFVPGREFVSLFGFVFFLLFFFHLFFSHTSPYDENPGVQRCLLVAVVVAVQPLLPLDRKLPNLSQVGEAGATPNVSVVAAAKGAGRWPRLLPPLYPKRNHLSRK